VAQQNTVARSLHDIGLASWFGGSLMGAVGLNGAAAEVDAPTQRARVANAGWARWTPANLVGIVLHLVGSLILTNANRGRLQQQQGVAGAALTKGALTAAALGATAYSRVLGRRIQAAGDVPVEGGAEPSEATPPDVAKAQQQLRILQWAIPALTGGILVVNARMGEQQRPEAVAEGLREGVGGEGLDRVTEAAKSAVEALAGGSGDEGDIATVQGRNGIARRILRRA